MARNQRLKIDAILHGIAVVSGAALVFQIQPLAGKLLLPSFGGGSSVWTTCMFFFQSMLLAGYGYAHLVTRFLTPRRQSLTHGFLLLLSVIFLPLAIPAETLQSTAGQPGLLIFLTLTVSAGFPFVLLASTAPLIQRWSSMTQSLDSPYRLYAFSNAGALVALLSYPLVVEPRFSLHMQTLLWTAGYVAFVILSLAACRLLWRRALENGEQKRLAGPGSPAPLFHTGRFAPVDQLQTVLLSACGVIVLLAITDQMTQNIAPIPFLWILPLVAYLLTYITCFSGERWYDRAIWGSLFVVAAATLLILNFFGTLFAIIPVVVAYLLVLICTCMVCHGELYRLRPQPLWLTQYYVLIALGGALGGALVSVIAPLIFNWYWDGLVGSYVVFLLLGIAVFRDKLGRKERQSVKNTSTNEVRIERWALRLFAVGWAAGVIVFPALALLLGALRIDYDVASTRNFYGVLNVRDEVTDGLPRRILIDGTTVHGFQLLEETEKMTPTSYYAAHTGIGLLLSNPERRREGLHVGVVGLGTGTLAAYGEPLDRFRFYELNPAVVHAAENHFSFLRDSAASITIVPGDARMSMMNELAQAKPQNYDLLVVDAFNSDAIPVHLLTLEAMRIYLSHLQPSGVLAFHVTNNYLDLAPVIARLGASFGKKALLVTTVGADESLTADWVLLGEHAEFIWQETMEKTVVSVVPPSKGRPWSDDYSNILSVLRN